MKLQCWLSGLFVFLFAENGRKGPPEEEEDDFLPDEDEAAAEKEEEKVAPAKPAGKEVCKMNW